MESKKITKCLLAVYLLALSWIIIFKMQLSLDNLPHIRNINLIPFGDSAITNDTIDISEIINNLLAFIPFGIFTGMLLDEKSFIKKVLPAFFVSLAFETVQFIFAIGASDITDLLMNTAGGVIGTICFFLLSQIFKNKTNKILNIICMAGAIFMILFIGILVFVNL